MSSDSHELIETGIGKSNSIERYHLEDGGSGSHADGVMDDAARFSDIFDKHQEKVYAASTASGFAPMDVIATANGGQRLLLPSTLAPPKALPPTDANVTTSLTPTHPNKAVFRFAQIAAPSEHGLLNTAQLLQTLMPNGESIGVGALISEESR